MDEITIDQIPDETKQLAVDVMDLVVEQLETEYCVDADAAAHAVMKVYGKLIPQEMYRRYVDARCEHQVDERWNHLQAGYTHALYSELEQQCQEQ